MCIPGFYYSVQVADSRLLFRTIPTRESLAFFWSELGLLKFAALIFDHLVKFAALIFWGELGMFKFAAGICRAHSVVLHAHSVS